MKAPVKPEAGSPLFVLLSRVVVERCGFLTVDDLAELAGLWPACVVLVRCGAGRFLIAADQAAGSSGLLATLTVAADAADARGELFPWYVRDVSFPADSLPVLWFGSSLSPNERGI